MHNLLNNLWGKGDLKSKHLSPIGDNNKNTCMFFKRKSLEPFRYEKNHLVKAIKFCSHLTLRADSYNKLPYKWHIEDYYELN